MPGFDQTGPTGAGPMTGGGWGYCTGYRSADQRRIAPYYRCGRGFGGGGRGWRHQYYATGLTGWQRVGYIAPTPEQEISGLKNTAEWLKQQLEAVTRRIEEIEKQERN
jgi:hypothetical protein